MDQTQHSNQKHLSYKEMLDKLNSLYDEKERIESSLLQINYDIEFLETMIMYRYNKEHNGKKNVTN